MTLPPPPDDDKDFYDIYQNYEIQAEQRDSLKKFLETKGVGTILQWGGFSLNNFDDIGLKKSLPNTDLMTPRFLMLPMNSILKDEEVIYISKQIKSFYK